MSITAQTTDAANDSGSRVSLLVHGFLLTREAVPALLDQVRSGLHAMENELAADAAREAAEDAAMAANAAAAQAEDGVGVHAGGVGGAGATPPGGGTSGGDAGGGDGVGGGRSGVGGVFTDVLGADVSAAPALPKAALMSGVGYGGIARHIEVAAYALKLLPPDAAPMIIVATDGVLSVPDLSTYDNLVMQLVRHDIACHIVQVTGTAPTMAPLGLPSDPASMQYVHSSASPPHT